MRTAADGECLMRHADSTAMPACLRMSFRICRADTRHATRTFKRQTGAGIHADITAKAIRSSVVLRVSPRDQ